MTRTQVSTENAPRSAGAYSQGIVAGGFLYTAGLGPQDPATGKIVSERVGEQTEQVMRNLGAVLAERGLDFSHVVKVTAHLQELHRDMPEFNAVYERFVTEPRPVRTTVGSTLGKGMLVEIDLVALAG